MSQFIDMLVEDIKELEDHHFKEMESTLRIYKSQKQLKNYLTIQIEFYNS